MYTQQGTEDFLRTFWNKATEYLILLSYGVFYSDLWCLIEHSISKMSTIIVPSCVSESHVVPIVCLFWSRELYPKWRHFFFTWNTGRTKSLFVFTHIYYMYHSYALNWSKSHNFSIQVTYKIILKLGFSWFWELWEVVFVFCFLFACEDFLDESAPSPFQKRYVPVWTRYKLK